MEHALKIISFNGQAGFLEKNETTTESIFVTFLISVFSVAKIIEPDMVQKYTISHSVYSYSVLYCCVRNTRFEFWAVALAVKAAAALLRNRHRFTTKLSPQIPQFGGALIELIYAVL